MMTIKLTAWCTAELMKKDIPSIYTTYFKRGVSNGQVFMDNS